MELMCIGLEPYKAKPCQPSIEGSTEGRYTPNPNPGFKLLWLGFWVQEQCQGVKPTSLQFAAPILGSHVSFGQCKSPTQTVFGFPTMRTRGSTSGHSCTRRARAAGNLSMIQVLPLLRLVSLALMTSLFVLFLRFFTGRLKSDF